MTEKSNLSDGDIKEIAGTVQRRVKFKRGARITLEEIVEKFGAHRAKCRNCAFLKGSPERLDFAECYPSQFSTILERIDAAVNGEAPFEPFFCHRDMPTNDGGKTFRPELDAEGLPAGHKICAGWMREVEAAQSGETFAAKIRRVMDEEKIDRIGE